MIDVAAYLARIGFDRPVRHDEETLEALQRAHLTAVPFENLHVYYERDMATTVDWSYRKIVESGRGGWCFELNGSFASLLRCLGFEVTTLAAAVLLEDSDPEVDRLSHTTIEVKLDQAHLVDVGFGDSFIRPLPLDHPGRHDGGTGAYWFKVDGDVTTLWAVGDNGEAKPLYRFRRRGVEMASFAGESNRLRTDTTLHWHLGPFATRLLDGGPDRVTLRHDRIKFRRGGVWAEEPVHDDEWAATLQHWFGMTP